MTDNMPPSALDANPPGTPSYVIAPGDRAGRRNSQIPDLAAGRHSRKRPQGKTARIAARRLSRLVGVRGFRTSGP